MERKFLPISIDISSSKILIIGGGQSALKKIRILLRSGAHLEVVAENIIDEVYETGIVCFRKRYEKSDLNGYLMLYSCTNNEELDKQIDSAISKRGRGKIEKLLNSGDTWVIK